MNKNIQVSVFIVCKDSESTIQQCLDSLEDFAEIIVVEYGSTDNTVSLVKAASKKNTGIKLVHNKWEHYAQQKQFALDQCSLDWCLNIDSDEVVTKELADAINNIISSNQPTDYKGYKFRRVDCFLDGQLMHKWHRHSYKPRLAMKTHAKYNATDTIHEDLVIDGAIGTINEGNFHHLRCFDEESYNQKLRHYAELKVQKYEATGKRTTLIHLVFSPILEFYKFYIWNRGFLSGLPAIKEGMRRSYFAYLAKKIHYFSK